MRIVVSGTHASGKSTLIADFAAAHPGYRVLPDPFELLDEAAGADAAGFVAQLRVSAGRLTRLERGDSVIAERGPLDFLAYLDALGAADLVRAAAETTRVAMAHVDLLVVLPLSAADGIRVPADEDPGFAGGDGRGAARVRGRPGSRRGGADRRDRGRSRRASAAARVGARVRSVDFLRKFA